MKFTLSTPCVDDCYALTPKEVIGIHYKVKNIRLYGSKRPQGLTINYYLDNPAIPEEGATVIIGNNEPQSLDVVAHELTFGIRYYFRCPCGKRVDKLFLPPGGHKLLCRICHDLPYKTWIMKPSNSALASKLHKLSNMERLTNSRDNIGNIMYRGKFTKKFTRFLKTAKKAGLDDFVSDTEGLLDIK